MGGTSTVTIRGTASVRTSHLSCRECRKWDVGPLHRLEYEGWQVNSTDLTDSLCPECVKAKEETK